MNLKILNQWTNPTLVGLLILFSLPIKITSIQQILENNLGFSFPIRLSLYTLFLPPVALFSLFWNRNRALEIWNHLKLPLIILVFLFFWMWLGAIMSEYQNIALKHSARYSIFLLTFIAFIFALDRESFKKSGHIVIGIYIFLMTLTFLDWYQQINIPDLLLANGLSIDLFERGEPQVTSFFENRNPYAVASVGVLFLSIAFLRNYKILSSLGIITSLYSLEISLSRNGIFTLVICLLIFTIIKLIKIRKPHILFSLVLGTTFLIGIFLFSMDSQVLKRTKISLNHLFNVKNFEDLKRHEIRFLFYSSALKFGLEKLPILGSGSKTFGFEVIGKSEEMKDYNKPDIKEHYFFHSHNALLTIWIEMGWVGLIAALMFLWLWILPALRGPPHLMMPVLAVCVGQILDYFVWEILFMAFQSFFFAYLASNIFFLEEDNNPHRPDS